MYKENIIRQKAKEFGYKIIKDFIRYQNNEAGNPIAYNLDGKPERGYSIIDAKTNCLVAGADSVFMNILDLDDVEAFLMNQE